MPYNIYECQYSHQGPGDNVFVNTFHVATANAQEIDLTPDGIIEGNGVFTALYDFYNDWAPSGMSPAMDNPGTKIKIYNITNPAPPHPPVYAYSYASFPYTTASSSAPLPWEIACCLSFEAFLSEGTIRARRRGRVYLGPLTMEALEWNTENVVYIAPSFRAAVINAYMTLVDTLIALGYEIGPYSRVDHAFHFTSTVWVDDAPDIQRRRGQPPTVKTAQDRLPDNTGWLV